MKYNKKELWNHEVSADMILFSVYFHIELQLHSVIMLAKSIFSFLFMELVSSPIAIAALGM